MSLPVFLTGLLTGLSLIVAIGAQNAYVLRLGLARNHVGVAVAICAGADGLWMAISATSFKSLAKNMPRPQRTWSEERSNGQSS